MIGKLIAQAVREAVADKTMGRVAEGDYDVRTWNVKAPDQHKLMKDLDAAGNPQHPKWHDI